MKVVGARGLYGLFVAGVGVAGDAGSGIVGQHALEAHAHFGGAIGDDYLASMQRVADADATAMMERHPRRAAGDVEHRVEERPVGDGVGAITHSFGLSERRRYAAGIQMIAANHDRRGDFTLGDKIVDRDAEPGAIGLSEPANSSRQALKLDLLLR